MRYLLLFLFLLISSIAQSQEALEKNVEFLSYPEKVSVTVSDKKDKTYEKSCTTPCKLKLDRQRKLIFLGTKDGYQNSDKSGAFYTNELNPALALFDDPSFAQATPAIRLTLLPLEKQKTGGAIDKQMSLADKCENYETPKDFVRPIPIKTKPPKMPKRAKESGYCKMKYNIDSSGSVVDVTATLCTNKMFKRPSIKSLKGWKYKPPSNPDGLNYHCNLENKISYGFAGR